MNSTQSTIIIVVVIAIVVAAGVIIGMGSTPPAADNAVAVYIDGTKQSGNYSEAQTLDWGTVAAGNTYTKNFTVVNNAEQSLMLKLYTAEPTGTSQAWAKNLTTIAPTDKAEATLVLTLSENPTSGKYTWRLLAVNGTSPTPTPTTSASPTPSPTPTPNALQFTIEADLGCKNITVTKNSEDPFFILGGQLPKTYLFTNGDKFKFQIALESDYIWNGWDFNDGTTNNMNNPVTVTKTGNYTITARIIAPEGVTD